jgi:hypothetical protein
MQRRDPLWKRIFTARLPVPVPVAALIALVLLVSSALALRSSPREVLRETQPAIVTAASSPKVIEVPVFRERLVTRTVYVEKKEREKVEATGRRPAPALKREATALKALNTENESGEGGIFTRANLTGFQPPDALVIRIVKRSNFR